MLILFIVSNTIIMEIRPKVNNNRIRKQKNFPRTFGTFPKIGIFDFFTAVCFTKNKFFAAFAAPRQEEGAAYHDWIDRCDDGRGRAHQGQHD